MTVADRLGAIDEAYLLMEEPTMPLHVASVGIFERGGLCTSRGRLRIDAVREHIAARLDRLPRLRQRLAPVPFGLARPVWVDDDHFDIANHVDTTHIGRANDEAALLRMVEELLMQPLDRSRPLWHLRFITGLENGRVALVERAHHALIDGVSGVDVSLVLLDTTVEPPAVAASSWQPQPPPPAGALALDAVVESMLQPARVGRAALRAVRHPERLVGAIADAVKATSALGSNGLIAPPTSLGGTIGATRRLAIVRERLASVRAVAVANHASVNDVALCAVAGGLRELFLGRAEPLPTTRQTNVLVPVSVRAGTETNALGNRVGGMITPLPIGIGDPLERLHAISAVTRKLKSSGEAVTADRLLQAADQLPRWLTRRVTSAVNSQPLVSMVVTNIPGPDFPLYALGSRLLEAFPVVPLGAGMTLEVALLSYDGQLNLTVTSDPQSCPDADVFTRGIEDAFAELGAAWTPAIA